GAPTVLPAAVSAQTAAQPGRLVLPHKEMAAKAQAYFKRIGKDKEAQKAFVENPTKHLIEEVLPAEYAKKISPQRVSNANRFLYAAIANVKFRTWVQEYQKELATKKVDRAQRYKDISKALVQAGDPALILAVLDEQELRNAE